MFCTNCGKQLQEGSSFCPYCGTRLAAPPQAVPEKKKKKFPVWLIILLAALGAGAVILVLVLALLLGSFFLLNKEQEVQRAAPDTEVILPTDEVPEEIVPAEKQLSIKNPYAMYLPSPDSYIMPDSNTRYLDAYDLSHLEHDHLVAIRNEIFARHGYVFESEDLKELFNYTDWYRPDPDFSTKSFNKYEQANVTLCQLYERKQEGVEFSSDNPYKRYFNGSNSYILPNSSTEYIYDGDLRTMTKAQATLARNEILARRGYTFESENLLEYFLQCDWYYPNTPPGDTSSLGLSKLENSNIETLKAYENALEATGDLNKLDTALTLEVSADAYRLYVPAYWKSCAICEDMRFCEKFSHDSWGGHLFSLVVCADEEEFCDHPSYEVWGTLTDSDGNTRFLVAMYPTDVQSAPGYHALYSKMYDEIDRIRGTVKANEGYTFTAQ